MSSDNFFRAGVRPAPSLMCEFITENKGFGVAPIYRAFDVLGWQMAPRTFYAWAQRAPSKRALSDLVLTEFLAGIYVPDSEGNRPPEALYGVTKMWAHLNRQGIRVAKCTELRLMAANGWQGTTRHRTTRTTIPGARRTPGRGPRGS
jgi:putative transposase